MSTKYLNLETTIVTTSWDDGHHLDMRMMKLLKKFNIKGTFYIPLKNHEVDIIKEKDIKVLSEYFEIGGHALNHNRLTELSLNDAKNEILLSKKLLEEIIDKDIQMFCYPGGYYNKRVIDLVKSAGYIGARTVEQYRTDISKDPFKMWTTIHAHSQSTNKYIGNVMRYRNLSGLKHIKSLRFNLIDKSKYFFDHVCDNGGIFHVWGHSWEIEQYGLWNELENILKYISNKKDVIYLSNSEILNANF